MHSCINEKNNENNTRRRHHTYGRHDSFLNSEAGAQKLVIRRISNSEFNVAIKLLQSGNPKTCDVQKWSRPNIAGWGYFPKLFLSRVL